VLLSNNNALTVSDYFPLNIFKPNAITWLQDIVAPFYVFIKMKYACTIQQDENGLNNNKIVFTSTRCEMLFGKQKNIHTSSVTINNGQLHSFTFQLNNQTIQALCSN